jgi:hypothetical protein
LKGKPATLVQPVSLLLLSNLYHYCSCPTCITIALVQPVSLLLLSNPYHYCSCPTCITIALVQPVSPLILLLILFPGRTGCSSCHKHRHTAAAAAADNLKRQHRFHKRQLHSRHAGNLRWRQLGQPPCRQEQADHNASAYSCWSNNGRHCRRRLGRGTPGGRFTANVMVVDERCRCFTAQAVLGHVWLVGGDYCCMHAGNRWCSNVFLPRSQL